MSCEEALRDLSDYIDEELDPSARHAFEAHVQGCRQCASLLEGTRNLISVYRDERVFRMPEGMRERIEKRIREEIAPTRRAFLAWTLTAAATLPLGLALFSARSYFSHEKNPQTPSPQQNHPSTGLVAVSVDSKEKVFHLPNCPKLEGKPRFLSAEEAIREGYTPCPYCLGKDAKSKKS